MPTQENDNQPHLGAGALTQEYVHDHAGVGDDHFIHDFGAPDATHQHNASHLHHVVHHDHEDIQMHDQQHEASMDKHDFQQKSNIFSGMVITWSGKFVHSRETLRRLIEEHGGQCVDNVSKKVSHVLTTSDIAKPLTNRVEQALRYGIPLLDEQYIHDCISHGQRLEEEKYHLTQQAATILAQQQADPSMGGMDEAQAAQFHHLQGIDATTLHNAAALGIDPANLAAHGIDYQNAQDPNNQQLRMQLQQLIQSHGVHEPEFNDGGVSASMENDVPGSPSMTGTLVSSPGLDMSEGSKFTVKMYVKGSRQTVFSEQFPEILYTLTWKHKYDVRIVSNKKIFKGDQNRLMEAFTMSLVLAKTNEIPIYDEDKEVKRRRKRQKIAKRKQKKPTDTDTITVSSLHKAAENEIIIRFGINSTFCSKRFNYSAFRLFINYASQDVTDDYHFTIYSAEFKTFVKKNANITKYLHFPAKLNPTTTIITKDSTTRTKTKYAQISKHDTGSSFGTEPGSAVARKTGRKRKRNQEYEEGEYDDDDGMDDQHGAGEWAANMNDPSLFNMIYPFLPMLQQGASLNSLVQYPTNLQKNYEVPQKGIQWFGDPIGMNINGDVFYMAFCKDGVTYRINDFVYLAPEEQGGEGAEHGTIHDPSMMGAHAEAMGMHGVEGMQNTDDGQVHTEEQQPKLEKSEETSTMPVDSTTQQTEAQVTEPAPSNAEEVTANAQPADTTTTNGDAGEGQAQDEDDEEIEPSNGNQSAPESYWICKIINLVLTKGEGMKLIGQWFYRWCDVQGFGANIDNLAQNKKGKLLNLQKEKEVFVSFDLNYNSLSTVRGKCFVKHMDDENVKKHKKWLGKAHHYYFQSGFNRLRHETFPLPPAMLKIMQETTNDDEDDHQMMQHWAMAAQQHMASQPHAMQHQQAGLISAMSAGMPHALGAMAPGLMMPGMQGMQAMQGMQLQMPGMQMPNAMQMQHMQQMQQMQAMQIPVQGMDPTAAAQYMYAAQAAAAARPDMVQEHVDPSQQQG